MSEAEVEAHNRRELWRDVANHLRVAHESIEQAQRSLEDLGEQVLAEKFEPSLSLLGAAMVVAEARPQVES